MQDLSAIEQRYGVDRQYSGGHLGPGDNSAPILGNNLVVASPGDNCTRRTRPDFAHAQFDCRAESCSVANIRREGNARSWPGRMGQTQVYPTSLTYTMRSTLTQAAKRDIWNSSADALGLQLQLSESVHTGRPASRGMEVSAQPTSDYALADMAIRKPISEWKPGRENRRGGGSRC